MARAPGSRDYRDGDLVDPEGKSAPIKRRPPSLTGERGERRWWEKQGRACAESVTSIIGYLQTRQEQRLRNMVRNARIYGNIGQLGLGSSAFGRLLDSAPSTKKYPVDNATASGLDTLVSHIGETKPRCYYLTSGGD